MRAQSQNPVHQAAHFLIGGNQSFGVRLTERDMQRPLVTVQLPKTVQSEAATFGAADSSGAHEQERVGVEVVGAAEFLLQPLVVIRAQSSGQLLGHPWKVRHANHIALNAMAIGGQIIEQTPEIHEIVQASLIAQGGALLMQPTEPAQYVGIAAQL
jgi:hypothetical protein